MRRTFLMALILSSGLSAVTPGPDELPLFFVPNLGQAASPVRFMVKSSGLTAHLLTGEIELQIASLAVTMRFEGANPWHRVEGAQALPGHVNFLTGSEANWRINLPLYGSVVYRELYPGIDMEYGSSGRNLKSEYRVAAGADPSRIRVRYVGAGDPWIDADRALVVPLGGTELREGAPLVYQERAGVRQMVAARFLVHEDGTVGFGLGDYDVARPLVIDPILSYSTLLGGSGFDSAIAIAVDASGSAYVAGFTDSLNFPVTNPVQGLNGGGNDVFVAKLSPAGNSLIYCTYLGGAADDRASGIAIDAQGSAYVTGSTTSHDFPVRSALQSKLAGYRNAFVVKLNPAGNSLAYSTYLGGNASDAANGIAVDASGAAYITGDTTSFSFPSTGFQRSTHGGQDAFVAKLSADGTRLVYSTYLGGSSEDHATAIAVDSAGTVCVTGATTSTDFPVLNAAQRSNAGGQDAFVTRLSADGNYLLFSTYLGGSGGTVMYPEIGQSIALGMNGDAYVTGVTSSPDFPLVAALQAVRKGGLDAFVTKMTPSGAIVYSTYLGGSGVDMGNAIAVDASGAAYVAGYTISTDLPVPNALQSVNAGDYDAFLAKLSPAGDVVQYLSYWGGSGSDSATAIALDPAANVYMAGYTLSTNFPLLNAFQSGNGGNYGAFVTKVAFGGAAVSVSVTPTSVSLTAFQSQQFSAAVVNSLNTAVAWSISPAGVGTISSSGLYTAPSAFSMAQVVTVTATSVADASKSATATVTLSNAAGSNLALGKAATQSSTLAAAVASNAVDGNIDGNYYDGSVTHTNGDANGWWQVDLGASDTIASITIWNRMDGGVAARLSDYWVFVSDTAFQSSDTPSTLQGRAGTWSSHQTTFPNPSTNLTVNTHGRYVRVQLSGTNYLSLAEVQVFGNPPSVGVSVTPTTATLSGAQSLQFTASVVNTQTTTVTWSLSPNVGTISSTGLYAAPGSISGQQLVTVTATSVADPSKSATATVTLVNITNLALGKAATQSSTLAAAVASNAVDGNIDGNYYDGSVTHTNGDANGWWQVDLGASDTIASITIWNRMDGGVAARLSDYWVFVSDTAFQSSDTPSTLQGRAGTWSSHQTTFPNPSTNLTVNTHGRYVRVQLSGTNYLSLAEVQVFGNPPSVGVSVTPTTATLSGAQSLQFTASVVNTQTTTVTWSLSPNVGTISSTGLYAAPGSISGQQLVTVTATSVADPSKSATATVTLVNITNLALGKAAAQSSTLAAAVASNAVDGNTDGNYYDGSVTHTNGDANGWWQVDLGASDTIASITIWNRMDGGVAARLSDYWVFVSDTAFQSSDTPSTLQGRAGTWSSHQTTFPNPSTNLTVNTHGRYVRVQLSGTNYLSLAEVQVFGNLP